MSSESAELLHAGFNNNYSYSSVVRVPTEALGSISSGCTGI